jgi:sigma-E factor negative regulatory protein RseA
MTDQIREQISALLDGELARDELGLLVRRMERDSELRRAFGNYVLIGEALRAPGALTASRTFASRVTSAIDEQPGAVVANADVRLGLRSRWTRPVVATAVAASAAVAAVLLWHPGVRDVGNTTTADTNRDDGIVEAPMPTDASPTLEQSQRLASYLVAHSQFSSPIGRRTVLVSVLSEDPAIDRVSYETIEAP